MSSLNILSKDATQPDINSVFKLTRFLSLPIIIVEWVNNFENVKKIEKSRKYAKILKKNRNISFPQQNFRYHKRAFFLNRKKWKPKNNQDGKRWNKVVYNLYLIHRVFNTPRI
jgi:hypothetical protein